VMRGSVSAEDHQHECRQGLIVKGMLHPPPCKAGPRLLLRILAAKVASRGVQPRALCPLPVGHQPAQPRLRHEKRAVHTPARAEQQEPRGIPKYGHATRQHCSVSPVCMNLVSGQLCLDTAGDLRACSARRMLHMHCTANWPEYDMSCRSSIRTLTLKLARFAQPQVDDGSCGGCETDDSDVLCQAAARHQGATIPQSAHQTVALAL
jgi:hypothetical protein